MTFRKFKTPGPQGECIINLDLVSMVHPSNDKNTTEVHFATGESMQIELPYDDFLKTAYTAERTA